MIRRSLQCGAQLPMNGRYMSKRSRQKRSKPGRDFPGPWEE
jgi:hypothetical protein